MSVLSLVEFAAKLLLVFVFGLFGYAKLSPNIDADHHRELSNMFRSKYTPLWQNSLQKYLGIDYDSMPINPVIFQTVVGWSELIICFLFCVSILGDVAGFRNLTFIGASLATILMIGATCTDYLLYNDCVSKSFNSDKCKFEQMSSILLGINLLLALIRFPFKSKRKTK